MLTCAPPASRMEREASSALAPYLASVAELWPDDAKEWPGAVCVARTRGRAESRVTEFLRGERIPYYVPVEQVVKYYDRQRRTWTRTLFPGHVFIGGGWNGREVAARCGRMFSDTVYGFIDVHGQRQLRGELLNLSLTLDADPTLKAIEQLKPGIRARVIAGKFEGIEGDIVREASRAQFVVSVHMLGRGVELEVASELLEPV